ncbi:MAG: cation transporter [Myxococcales bacterium]|nr:cation transporter [Myxococcales bacterium]
MLRIVLALNLAMFLVEGGAGLFARSSALLGDSLDMLGDALAYGATLFVLHRGAAWKARATVLKGVLMALTGLGVLVAAVVRARLGETPGGATISGIGFLALVVNGLCLLLLTRHRGDDMNLASAWTCSRNDLVANASVIAAGAIVALTGSLWPDFIVGVGIAVLFTSSAATALRNGLGSSETLTRKAA